MHYVTDRWLGGALTNFRTIRLSINRLIELEALRDETALAGRSKKEVASLRREEQKLHRNLDGIRRMENLPGVMIVFDIGRELNAVREARKLSIPIVGVVDTNCDPTLVDFAIPCNDDGIRAIKLIVSKIEEATLQGIELRKQRIGTEKAEKEKKRKESGAEHKRKSPPAKPSATAGKKKTKPAPAPKPLPSTDDATEVKAESTKIIAPDQGQDSAGSEESKS
jgi:small subunit ribosomal protein S2